MNTSAGVGAGLAWRVGYVRSQGMHYLLGFVVAGPRRWYGVGLVPPLSLFAESLALSEARSDCSLKGMIELDVGNARSRNSFLLKMWGKT